MAVYFAMLRPGDTLLGMDLSCGGHLTHGHRLSYSGRDFNVVAYGVDRATERIDFDEVERLALEHRPKLIVCGASAYSRTIDFARFREIADRAGALLMADIAHIAGLVAAGLHPSPVPHCHFVTTTTHKTLRGPRGGMILCTRRVRQGDRPRRLPRHPGRPADAHHRRQGGGVRRGARRRSSAPTRRRSSPTPRASPRRSPARRLPDRLGRHRQPPLPGRRRLAAA